VTVYCENISKYKRTGNTYLFQAKVRANTPYVTYECDNVLPITLQKWGGAKWVGRNLPFTEASMKEACNLILIS